MNKISSISTKIRGIKFSMTICLILLLTITMLLAAIPTISSQKPIHQKATHAYIGATPNPIGVGQETLIHVGITDELQHVSHGWEGLTVTVTKPDGTKETLGPLRADSTGGTGTVYVPNMVGNYTLQTHFPAQWYNWTSSGGADIYYESSDSQLLTLTVNEEPKAIWPGIPLPTEYWTRPIDAQFREWNVISGSWLALPDNRYTPYNDGPESPHILWTKPLAMGGLAGGEFKDQSMECGAAYEQKFGASAIINGILYYNRFEERGGTNVEQEVVAVDLHRGEEIWTRNWNNTRLGCGQLFYWDSYNYHGVFGYLWSVTGNTWKAYDAQTGRWVYSMTNVPASLGSYGGSLGSNTMFGPKGEIYAYTANLRQGWLTLWNSSRAVSSEGSWRPHGNTYNCIWSSPRQGGYEWNKTIPNNLPGSANKYFFEDLLFGIDAESRTATLNIAGKSADPVAMWAINLKPGQEGQMLYNKVWSRPAGNLTITVGAVSQKDRVFTLWSKELTKHWAFNLDTGNLLWESKTPQPYLDVFGAQNFIAYGKLFSVGMSGILHCYDLSSGNLLWTYNYPDTQSEVLWSNSWPLRISFITDGKVYLETGEHSPVDPKPRGGPFICVDVETGEEVWSLSSMWFYYRSYVVIGDSIIAIQNSYDNQIYAIGKGPSATTVTTPDTAASLGTPIVIKGTVMDVSPGTKDTALTMRFPNGVPAISDGSMDAWMKYVYQQFPHPTNAEGVEVTIDVVDSNSNYRNIGTTTSDSNGKYSFTWTPDISGDYTVIATFAGSKSYYPSYDTSQFTVYEVPEHTQTTQPIQQTSISDQYFVPAVIGIILAIAIIGALILMAIKKRP
jgi:hypothetical protein